MEIISFIGIVAALILIILGSVRGYSLILLSTVAALLVAATGGVNVFENYANVYMGGVANMVLALFPIFLGGQMFGKMLEMSGLPMAVASGVFRKLGPASAVAAVPAPESGSWAYISAGTWALLGAEIEKPFRNADSEKNSFTNEGGLDGKIRFLSNIMGSWLFQETRRVWNETKPTPGWNRWRSAPSPADS